MFHARESFLCSLAEEANIKHDQGTDAPCNSSKSMKTTATNAKE
jgi:hypothetical protein